MSLSNTANWIMEENLLIQRTESIKKFPEKFLLSLEDKQVDLILGAKSRTWESYRKKRLKRLTLTILFCWTVLPVLQWQKYRSGLSEWQEILKMDDDLQELQKHRKKRRFWKKFWSKKNRVQTDDFHSINQFYRTLIHSIRQYNIRLDLFDYSLDRQNKKLDPPYTVGELEQIEKTFNRISNELSSAVKLLEVAEAHTDMDLASLLNDQYGQMQSSTEFVSQTVDFANSGQFVQDLLIIETSLRDDIAQLSKTPNRSSSREMAHES